MFKYISQNENDTINFACKLASYLQNGDIIILSGDLGSGKTKFTQGILKFFLLDTEISSPTFTIVNEYNAPNNTNIYHFDVYRLADIDEFYALGGDEYFDNGICIIEWGELIENILPKNYLKIVFERDSSNLDTRILNIYANSDRLKNIMEVVLNDNS